MGMGIGMDFQKGSFFILGGSIYVKKTCWNGFTHNFKVLTFYFIIFFSTKKASAYFYDVKWVCSHEYALFVGTFSNVFISFKLKHFGIIIINDCI